MIRLWHMWKTSGALSVLTALFCVLTVSAGMEQQVAAQTPAASGAGNPLIGKFEGPEVVTDPAQFPQKFSESPQLAERVKAGKLPPVAERLGQDPLVIKPVHAIGKYGGT
jgi:peptide/nickel transport system substrate-binding protein